MWPAAFIVLLTVLSDGPRITLVRAWAYVVVFVAATCLAYLKVTMDGTQWTSLIIDYDQGTLSICPPGARFIETTTVALQNLRSVGLDLQARASLFVDDDGQQQWIPAMDDTDIEAARSVCQWLRRELNLPDAAYTPSPQEYGRPAS